MKNAREPIWWLPLLRRVLVWSALSGLCVSAFFFVLSLSFILLFDSGNFYGLQREGALGYFVNTAAQMTLFVGAPAFILGSIMGCLAGLCAPPHEPASLFISLFFRRILIGTLAIWFFALLIFGLLATFVIIAFEPWAEELLSSEILLFGTAFVLFVLSLWRATNRALAAAKLK